LLLDEGAIKHMHLRSNGRRRQRFSEIATFCIALLIATTAQADVKASARIFEDAKAAYDRGDYAAALKLFRPLAEQGFSPAQAILGMMYEQGQGAPPNYVEAIRWFRLAADQHNPVAQLGLGAMYSRGEGVPQDDAEAAKWYRPAADQGVAMAQYNLGVRYYEGRGVQHDYVLAHLWFNLAAAQHYRDAAKNRDLAEQQMTPAQIDKARKLAREWKPTANRFEQFNPEPGQPLAIIGFTGMETNAASAEQPTSPPLPAAGGNAHEPTNDCVLAAFTQYNKANVALLLNSDPVMSVEAAVAQRRLMEGYCARFARCTVGDPTITRSLEIPFRVAFTSCLRDEQREKDQD
jgi:uncharacterized protein